MKDIYDGKMKLFRSICIMTLTDIGGWTRRFKLFKVFMFMDLNTLLQKIASCLFFL